jgi:hypothetical protein
MVEINIGNLDDVSIHLTDIDDNTHTTIGLTIDNIQKSGKFYKGMKEIQSSYNHNNPTNIIFVGKNMSIRGLGFLYKVTWKTSYSSRGRMKISFRVSEYEILSGQSMIRNLKLDTILNEA